MKKRIAAIAIAGITISTSMALTGKVFADNRAEGNGTEMTLCAAPMLRGQNGYTVSISGNRINLYRYGGFRSYFTYTNRENIVGYGYVTSGNQVRAAQAMLSYCASIGIGQDIGTDGILGPATVRQIKAVQRDYGIKADGIIGANTWRALIKYWNHQQ